MKPLAKYEALARRATSVRAPVLMECVREARALIEGSAGWLTLSMAMERTGHSRSYYKRRLRQWEVEGTAKRQHPGAPWLIASHVLPQRSTRAAVDLSGDVDEQAESYYRRLVA